MTQGHITKDSFQLERIKCRQIDDWYISLEHLTDKRVIPPLTCFQQKVKRDEVTDLRLTLHRNDNRIKPINQCHSNNVFIVFTRTAFQKTVSWIKVTYCVILNIINLFIFNCNTDIKIAWTFSITERCICIYLFLTDPFLEATD